MNKVLLAVSATALFFSGHSAACAEDPGVMSTEARTSIEPLELDFSKNGLVGRGGEVLRREMNNSQFIMIGEDHGFADAPALVAAFQAEAKEDQSYIYATEVGPISAEWVAQKLRDEGVDGLRGALQGRLQAIPFLSMREEAEVAALFLDEGQLWGIDQEFIASPLIHLDWLRDRGDDEAETVGNLLRAEISAFAAGDQSTGFISTANSDLFNKLRSIYSSDNEARPVIDALETSQKIYQSNFDGRGLDNNLDRVALIRRYFTANYKEVSATAEVPPRIIFKMGAVHAGRATSPMSTFDVGSLIEGMAAANGLDALHIAYLPVGGEQTYFSPKDESAFSVRDAGTQGKGIIMALEAAGVDMASIAESDGHFLIDLDQVRRKMGNEGLNTTNPMFRFLVLGFDYLVTTKTGKPATPLTND